MGTRTNALDPGTALIAVHCQRRTRIARIHHGDPRAGVERGHRLQERNGARDKIVLQS